MGSERYVKRLTGWKHFFGHYQKESPRSTIIHRLSTKNERMEDTRCAQMCTLSL